MLVAPRKEQTMSTMAEDEWMDMFFPSPAHHQQPGYSIQHGVNHLGEGRCEDVSQRGLPGSSPESYILSPALQGRPRWGAARQRGWGYCSLPQATSQCCPLGGFLLLQIATGPCTTG